MRYLVTAKVKTGQDQALERAIHEERLGRGSVAGDEYLRNMAEARQLDNGSVDRKSTRLNSSHLGISYAVFCLKKKNRHSPRARRRPMPTRRPRSRHPGCTTDKCRCGVP